MAEESIFSPSLRFTGDVVEVLPSSQTIRTTAIHRGRTFRWRGGVGKRVGTSEDELGRPGRPLDLDRMSVEELAESLRGLALFGGHEFFEVEPAYDLAHLLKLHQRLSREGVPPERLRALLPPAGPSQGRAERLRDLREAEHAQSAGPAPRVVHGLDDRQVFNNLIYPHRTQIVFDNTGSTTRINGSEGSGTMIGPSTALSAAHVFWDEVNNNWEADHLWAPGFDSQDADSSPYGDWLRGYWVTIPQAYTTNVNQNEFDYAVLDFDTGSNAIDNGVNSDSPGSTVGWLGTYTASDAETESRLAYVRGYPGVGTCGNPGQACNVRVWGDTSSGSENDPSSREIGHLADTSGGQSGSALYHYADPGCSGCGYGPYLVGIHRVGSSDSNGARRYDGTVLAFMRAHSGDW